MPMECALYYSNDIKGSNTKGGREDSTAVIEFDHEIYTPIDPQNGELTSSRIHKTVELLTELDKATPMLLQACADGNTLDKLEVKWYKISDGKENQFFTHTFEKVRVAGVEVILPNTKETSKEQQTAQAKVSLRYEKIQGVYNDGNIKFDDDWKAKPKK